jgi:hypothetical protein
MGTCFFAGTKVRTRPANARKPRYTARVAKPEAPMKALFAIGLIILALGILSFFIPVPHTEHHGVDVGGAHIGVDTQSSNSLPPAASIALVVVGAGLAYAGKRSGN